MRGIMMNPANSQLVEIAESNGSFYFVWPPCNRISLDKFEHLSNGDVINYLKLSC